MSFKRPVLNHEYYGPGVSNCGNKIRGFEKLVTKKEEKDEDKS